MESTADKVKLGEAEVAAEQADGEFSCHSGGASASLARFAGRLIGV